MLQKCWIYFNCHTQESKVVSNSITKFSENKKEVRAKGGTNHSAFDKGLKIPILHQH